MANILYLNFIRTLLKFVNILRRILGGIVLLIADYIYTSKNILRNVPIRNGEVAIVTGGGRGIGKYVVRNLVKCGYHVILTVRDIDGGNEFVEKLKREKFSGTAEAMRLDLDSLKSVRSFVKAVQTKYPKIHLLINNAGIIIPLYKRFINKDGFEKHFAVNYLGHFLLTHLLMKNLVEAGESSGKCARIVNVSSASHLMVHMNLKDLNSKYFYLPDTAYGISKLSQIMFTRYLNMELSTNNIPVRIYACNPGVVNTDLASSFVEGIPSVFRKLLLKTPEQGAISILHCCFSPALENPGGNYISNCAEGWTSRYSKNAKYQRKLFDITCGMLHIKEFGIDS